MLAAFYYSTLQYGFSDTQILWKYSFKQYPVLNLYMTLGCSGLVSLLRSRPTSFLYSCFLQVHQQSRCQQYQQVQSMFRLSPFFLSASICFFTWLIVPWYDAGVQPRIRSHTTDWLSENIFTPVNCFLPISFSMNSSAIEIATSSPRRIDARRDTGFFNSTHSSCPGQNTQAPASHGPGFCLQEPSVKMTTVPTSRLSIPTPVIYLLSSSCAFVLLLDDPRLFQHSDSRL